MLAAVVKLARPIVTRHDSRTPRRCYRTTGMVWFFAYEFLLFIKLTKIISDVQPTCLLSGASLQDSHHFIHSFARSCFIFIITTMDLKFFRTSSLFFLLPPWKFVLYYTQSNILRLPATLAGLRTFNLQAQGGVAFWPMTKSFELTGLRLVFSFFKLTVR